MTTLIDLWQVNLTNLKGVLMVIICTLIQIYKGSIINIRIMKGRKGKNIVELHGFMKWEKCFFFNFVVFNIICRFN
jgi:hypothetical protein